MKWFHFILDCLLLLFLIVFHFYFNDTTRINPVTITYYKNIKNTLSKQGFNPRLLVISGRRLKWHNDLQVLFSGAAKESWHLKGDAIDFLVFDVNNDGESNNEDVDIVYRMLEGHLLKTGGIGTYKNESNFVSRQMIHIDCRKNRTRWHH